MYTKNVKFTLTSGKSDLSGTKADVVVLFADIRGFSNWCNSAADLADVGRLIKAQYERVVQISNDQHPSFHKFLGDGFLLLWEIDEEMDSALSLNLAIDAAFEIHKKFWYFAKELASAPVGYGIGISMGSAVRIQPETVLQEMNEIDFLGYPLNCGARMQSLSGPYGVTLCSSTVARINQNREDFLCLGIPAFLRELHVPSIVALEKAKVANGLLPKDRTEFRHLTWPSCQPKLWKTDGILRT
jgi:class 3 adenylate cyclase